jgi:hypothetical protein
LLHVCGTFSSLLFAFSWQGRLVPSVKPENVEGRRRWELFCGFNFRDSRHSQLNDFFKSFIVARVQPITLGEFLNAFDESLIFVRDLQPLHHDLESEFSARQPASFGLPPKLADRPLHFAVPQLRLIVKLLFASMAVAARPFGSRRGCGGRGECG